MFCVHSYLFYGKLPWLIAASCLISEFQISGRTSETLGWGSWHPRESLSLYLQTSSQILVQGSWDQISSQEFHQIWSSNWLGIKKLCTVCLIFEFQMFTSETLGRGSPYPAEDTSLDFKSSLQIFCQCSWTRYLNSRISAEDLRTIPQI